MKPPIEVLKKMSLVLALAGPFMTIDGYAGTPEKTASVTGNANIQAPDRKPVPALAGQKETLSYAIGMSVAAQLRKFPMEMEMDSFMQGIKDSFSGGETLLSKKDAAAMMRDLQLKEKKRQVTLLSEKREKNKQEGETFLAANKAKEGVVTLESGLQYKILTAGAGKKPALDDTVLCHYRGSLTNGTEFDSTYKRNQPVTLAVGKATKGWSEALQRMPVGSKWQIFLPPSLAYGERGAGREASLDATLVFELELISIKDSPSANSQAKNQGDAAIRKPDPVKKEDVAERGAARRKTTPTKDF